MTSTIETIELPESKLGGINIGDKVISFDFEGNEKCYAEGEVTGYANIEGCNRYQIKVSKRVWDEREVEIRDSLIYPPINGTPSFLGETNFVKLV